MAIKGFPKAFEKSSKDKEGSKFGKEGSKREEAFDSRQAKAKPAPKAPAKRASGRGC
jgi:hypothetical protein